MPAKWFLPSGFPHQNLACISIVSFLTRANPLTKYFLCIWALFVPQNVLTGSEAHSAFYSMDTGVFFRRLKRPEREVDHIL
jgi:hypothetical protein